MTTVQDVIDFLKACRATHQDIVDWYDNGYDIEDADEVYTIGTREFHQQCVEEYTQAITVLEGHVLDFHEEARHTMVYG